MQTRTRRAANRAVDASALVDRSCSMSSLSSWVRARYVVCLQARIPYPTLYLFEAVDAIRLKLFRTKLLSLAHGPRVQPRRSLSRNPEPTRSLSHGNSAKRAFALWQVASPGELDAMPNGIKSYHDEFLGRIREKRLRRSEFRGLPVPR
jgi:hypothetical protein